MKMFFHEDAQVKPEFSAVQANSGQSPWEFLVVCKDPQIHKNLAVAMQGFGASARYSSDTASALAYLTRRKIDGIFIDTRTEGALQLIGTIRRGGSNRFAVILTYAGEDEDISRLLNAGANFVVHRPLDPREIKTVLKSAGQMITSERQRYQRHHLTLPVILKVAGRERKAVTCNISRGGMAVRCAESWVAGSALQFVLDIPHVDPICGRGEVTWASTDGMMGIRFYLMGQETKTSLWHWMEQRSRSRAAC